MLFFRKWRLLAISVDRENVMLEFEFEFGITLRMKVSVIVVRKGRRKDIAISHLWIY